MNFLKIDGWELLFIGVLFVLVVVSRFVPTMPNAYDRLLERPEGKYNAMRRLVWETALAFLIIVAGSICCYFWTRSDSQHPETALVTFLLFGSTLVLFSTWRIYRKISRY